MQRIWMVGLLLCSMSVAGLRGMECDLNHDPVWKLIPVKLRAVRNGIRYLWNKAPGGSAPGIHAQARRDSINVARAVLATGGIGCSCVLIHDIIAHYNTWKTSYANYVTQVQGVPFTHICKGICDQWLGKTRGWLVMDGILILLIGGGFLRRYA